MNKAKVTAVLLSAGCAVSAGAGELDEIFNYIEYSTEFASAGQPTAEQLQAVRDAGFERVIYIAFSDQSRSLANEDRLVKDLGMEYVHIPVDWEAPTASDFYLFAGAMQRSPGKKTLLHCQANYRATAFSFLYRVLYEDVPMATAKQDMDSIWTPNQTWRELIFTVLEENDVSPHCDGCDWPGD